MTLVVPESPLGRSSASRIPFLESGDRLTRSEFERRYNAMPELKKAELVEGVVFVGSPVRSDVHGGPHADMVTWLGTYRAMTPGTSINDNATSILDPDNEFQPDASLGIDGAFGGQSRVNDRGYIEGAPEFVAEVAASSASIDLNAKFEVYRRNKVREYLVWRTLDAQFDWFVLRGGEFERMSPDAEGLFRSEVFPGLWLDPAALLRGDMATVLKRLQHGLATPEHVAFAEKMKRGHA
ncbi:MAG TPA: Uma2 family endonuclease [Planctomycetaceae bacterium]|jgi:Uma2 family endonuclease